MSNTFNKYIFENLIIETIETAEELANMDYTENIDFWVTAGDKKYAGTGFTLENIRYLMSIDANSKNIFVSKPLIIFKNYEIQTIAEGLMKLYSENTIDLYLEESD